MLRLFDPWKSRLCTCPPKYSLAPYTGCSHACIYCYATSYIPEFFRPRPKQNFVEKLQKEVRQLLPSLVMISASSDPYQPLEKVYRYTRAALNILGKAGWRILITTKSDLVKEDAELLESHSTAVSMTVTTMDKKLAKKLEPGAPAPQKRMEALEDLNVPKILRLDPIIPGVNDSEENIEEVLEAASAVGVKHVVFSTYKARPDNFARMRNAFPELANLWGAIYTERKEAYIYAREDMRREILRRAASCAEKMGISWAFCREGFFFKAASCDGSHLIKSP